jgi:membrane-bound metal-dependent hydrolase YbcI (DUF457 family)
MLIPPTLMRTILYATVFIMTFLAAMFLRQRRLSLRAYLAWGLLAVLLPVLGPYLVIAARPGVVRR